MDALSEFIEYLTTADSWWGSRGLLHRGVEHVRISALSVVVAALIAIPVAMVLGHVRRGGVLANAIVNVGRAVPSFAILAFFYPLFLRWDLGSLGFGATFVAMVLLAIPPMFTNTYTGVTGIEPAVTEAARGMGMTGRDVLWRVEAPTALPLVMTGVRVAAVQVVATATLGGFFGLNNLGTALFEGHAQSDDGQLIGAAVAVAVLAILTEIVFSAIERQATPWVVRRRRRPAPVRDVQLRLDTPLPPV